MAIQALSEKEITSLLVSAPLWKREGSAIRRTFVHPGFGAAVEFVNRVAAAADKADHHPDILIQYNKVTLTLTTHDANNGLTQRDFDLAAKADELFAIC